MDNPIWPRNISKLLKIVISYLILYLEVCVWIYLLVFVGQIILDIMSSRVHCITLRPRTYSIGIYRMFLSSHLTSNDSFEFLSIKTILLKSLYWQIAIVMSLNYSYNDSLLKKSRVYVTLLTSWWYCNCFMTHWQNMVHQNNEYES